VAPVPRSAELSCAAVSALVTLGGPLRVNLDRIGLSGDVRFPPIATIERTSLEVRLVPEPEVNGLLDHPFGAAELRLRYDEVQRF
jgi:hypothetical protein